MEDFEILITTRRKNKKAIKLLCVILDEEEDSYCPNRLNIHDSRLHKRVKDYIEF